MDKNKDQKILAHYRKEILHFKDNYNSAEDREDSFQIILNEVRRVAKGETNKTKLKNSNGVISTET